MALSGTALGTSLATALGVTDTVAVSKLQDFANALVTYLVANTQVATTVTGSAATTTGPAVVAGTGTGTIT